jgi:hypothetical protein
MLPPGVSIEASRETSQSTPGGAIMQGMIYTLTLPSGTTTSMFIPYALSNNTAEIEALFAQRVAQIEAIKSIGS